MGTIEPIETEYKKYRFRSRLEARWAVFLDELGLSWNYELEGYELENGERYLPDFWLPQISMWAEVKGPQFTHQEIQNASLLSKGTGYLCLLLGGEPQNRVYPAAPPPEPEQGPDWMTGEDGPLYAAWSYCLTCYHSYPSTEGRLFACPGCSCYQNRDGGCNRCKYEDTAKAVKAARSAHFEHGETPE